MRSQKIPLTLTTSQLSDPVGNHEVPIEHDLEQCIRAGICRWDSLSNVRLFIELERIFGVRFSATEIASLENVGQLAESLERKIARSKP